MPIPAIIAQLISVGLPILASAVATKGKEVIQEKIGINIDEALGTEAGRYKLRELEIKHQEFLIMAAQASEARDFEYFKAEVADKASARERDSVFIRMGKHNYRADAMFILAIVVICSLVWVVWKDPSINEYVKGIFTLVLGRFLGYLDNIYNFEFGTTRSSRTKDTTIEKLSSGGGSKQ